MKKAGAREDGARAGQGRAGARSRPRGGAGRGAGLRGLAGAGLWGARSAPLRASSSPAPGSAGCGVCWLDGALRLGSGGSARLGSPPPAPLCPGSSSRARTSLSSREGPRRAPASEKPGSQPHMALAVPIALQPPRAGSTPPPPHANTHAIPAQPDLPGLAELASCLQGGGKSVPQVWGQQDRASRGGKPGGGIARAGTSEIGGCCFFWGGSRI